MYCLITVGDGSEGEEKTFERCPKLSDEILLRWIESIYLMVGSAIEFPSLVLSQRGIYLILSVLLSSLELLMFNVILELGDIESKRNSLSTSRLFSLRVSQGSCLSGL